MELIVSLGLGLSILVLIVGVAIQSRNQVAATRLSQFGAQALTLEERELRLPLTERIVLPIIRRLAAVFYRLTPGSQIAATRRFLVMAGHTGGVAVIEFTMRRIIVAVACGGVTVLLLGLARAQIPAVLGLTVMTAAMGYMLPSMWLGSRVRERQDIIQRTLPDALDLLTVCVEAGAGFEGAIARVVSKWHGPLSDEFDRMLADLRMGRERKDALRDMGERTGVLDVQAFAAALIQADQLGVGLVNVLRVQSEQMRLRRRIRAEEQAQKAPIKMLFPLIFMIFPALYLVILGPAAITLANIFGGG